MSPFLSLGRFQLWLMPHRRERGKLMASKGRRGISTLDKQQST